MLVAASPPIGAYQARSDFPRGGRSTTRSSETMCGAAIAPSASRVQRNGSPGSTSQPASRKSSQAGSTRLRRRLSRIFQRESSDSRLGSGPSGPGHPGAEPGQELPVAPDPAVLAQGEAEVPGRIVVVHHDVGDQPGAGVVALDQVVREQRVLGEAPAGRQLERRHVVDPLAGEAPLAVQVLVDVGDRGGVGIHARDGPSGPRRSGSGSRSGGSRRPEAAGCRTPARRGPATGRTRPG